MPVNTCHHSVFIRQSGPEGKYLLDKVELRSDRKDINSSLLMQYVRQKGNSRWFSLFKIPLGTYVMAGKDTTKWINRTLRRMGEEPVVYDTLQARLSCEDLKVAMQNMGYMKASVELDRKIKGKKTYRHLPASSGRTLYHRPFQL